MSVRTRTLTAALALLVAIPVVALAAWNPDEDEVEDYTDAVAAVRDDIADWLEDEDLDRATKVVLKVADRQLRRAENESSYRSASGLSFDDLIDPRDLRDAILAGLDVSARRRSLPAEPVARIGITPCLCVARGAGGVS